MEKKNKTNIVLIVGEIILPFVLSLVCQKMSIGRGYDFNLNVLFLNYILWLSILAFFISIFKKNYLSLSFYILFFFVFTILNRFRIKFLNEPLRFNDINFIGQAPDIILFSAKYTGFKKEIFLNLLGLGVSIWLIKKIIKIEFKNIRWRIILFLVSFIILTSPYFFPTTFNKILDKNRIIFHSWYRLENCQNNGMVMCFIYDAQFIKNKEPQNYNEATIKKIFEEIPQEITVKKRIKPNVIVVMSEALWDATKMPEIKFDPDPLTNIKKDIKGNIVSPTFGGGTANVEFEFLTGLSNFLFKDNSYPYTDLVRKKTPSLFNVFKENGYFTSVVHPYSQQFYNRKNVYKYFGADKFTSLDQMTDFEKTGPFVSDKFFTQEILKQFNSIEKPQFIFAISMQNHDLYEPNRFNKKNIKINGKLEKRDKDVLQTYIEGVELSDKAYGFLKDELKKKTDKPTIVVMFGDHLPFLNDDYSVYEKGGFCPKNENDWTEKDRVNMHSTPLVIWSNFEVKIKENQNIGLSTLANEVLDLAEIDPKYQFQFTSELRNKFPYLIKKISPENMENESLIKDYNLIQYDLLFGKQYVKMVN